MDNWEAETLNISGIVDDSIVDGPGLRLTIFTQGCPHHCPGCHNPQTHDRACGILYLCRDVRMDVRNATIRRHTVLKRTSV